MKVKMMTERQYEDRSFYQVAWEWEDAFIEALEDKADCGLETVRATKFKPLQFLYKFIYTKKQPKLLPIKNDLKLYIPLRVWHCNQYLGKRRFIPIFLDCYAEEIDVIYKMTKRLPFYFVTAWDIYDLIKRRYPDSKVYFSPLSVSDKWRTDNIPYKDIDVIQIGRRSELLHNYMLKYCEKHPEVNYVYLDSKQSWNYISTINGNMGKFETRDDFMNMLRHARISLTSTPGIETGRFGKIDFFTPRFFESAICYCHMIGHYTENKEAEMLNIASVCDNPKSYEEFEKAVDKYLQETEFSGRTELETFIDSNVTSRRANQVWKVYRDYLEKKQVGVSR